MKKKHIEVEANTHLKAKTQAAQRSMSMLQYIDYLVNKDKFDIVANKG